MMRKLIKHVLICLAATALGIGLMLVMHAAGSKLPERIIARISQQLPAQKPDSFFVPTPLADSPGIDPSSDSVDIDQILANVLNVEDEQSGPGSAERAEIAQLGTYNLGQNNLQRENSSSNLGDSSVNPGNNENGSNSGSPTPSQFAILAATPTPIPEPALADNTASASQATQSEVVAVAIDGSTANANVPSITGTEAEAAPARVASEDSTALNDTALNDTDAESSEQGSQGAQNAQPLQLEQLGLTVPSIRIPSLQFPPLNIDTDLVQPIKPAVALSNFSHEWQTWNNCGPATLAMNLSFFGSALNQTDIASVLRQHEDDKNVRPEEMVAFAQSRGYHAQMRVNGSRKLTKALLSNDIPVLIETWMEPDPNDGMGHYRLLTGYDDVAQHWIAFDSYVSHDFVVDAENYQGIILPYVETEQNWKVFNRTYLLIYDDAKTEVVRSIFGDALEPSVMLQNTLVSLRDEITQNHQDPFLWFNLGSTLAELGNYTEAAAAFDQARVLGLPWRMLWYQFGPFEAYYQTGRYEEVLALAYSTIATTESIEEVYYWKGRGLAATGNPQSARKAWQKALDLNPDFRAAADAIAATE